MNRFKFLYLNDLPVTKGMTHNSISLFLLNYLWKKKSYYRVFTSFRNI
jgi:hypothetical protein